MSHHSYITSQRILINTTNIATVKLFSHSSRESDYAEKGMTGFLGTVNAQMRLVTAFNICVEIANYLLVFSIAAISIYLWSHEAITIGSIAVAVSLALRINGMSKWIMWEVSSLFENIGTVMDGMSTISKPIVIQDKPQAPDLKVDKGEIEFKNVDFHYGDKEKGVISNLNLKLKAGEKVGIVGRSGAGKSTLVKFSKNVNT